MADPAPHRWSTKRPAIRLLMLLPALLVPLLVVAAHLIGVRNLAPIDFRSVFAIGLMASVALIIAYGLLTWKLVIEAHRRSGIGGLFGEEP